MASALLMSLMIAACASGPGDSAAPGAGADGTAGGATDGSAGGGSAGGGSADGGGTDGGTTDGGGTDGGTTDTGTAGGTAGDTGADGALPLDGFGSLSGDCGEIDALELTSAAPWLFSNTLDFGEDAFDEGDYELLSEGGREIFDDGNLGGSSLYSEIFAYEVLYRCEEAELLKTEGEIAYLDEGGKKTDLLVAIDGYTVGVSVTRAFAWPPEEPYTTEQALELLEGKLDDVLLSSANVDPSDAWVKQILHVIAYSPEHASAVEEAFAGIDEATRADTILVVTATEGLDEGLY